MTIVEWQDNAELVAQWRELIESPVFKQGLAVLESLSFAKMSPSIPAPATNECAQALFGQVQGYESFAQNIQLLAKSPEQIKQLRERYGKNVEA